MENKKVLCDWCHPKIIHHCSHCGKKISVKVGSGAYCWQPHSWHEFCSSKCEEIMINSWNF